MAPPGTKPLPASRQTLAAVDRATASAVHPGPINSRSPAYGRGLPPGTHQGPVPGDTVASTAADTRRVSASRQQNQLQSPARGTHGSPGSRTARITRDALVHDCRTKAARPGSSSVSFLRQAALNACTPTLVCLVA